MLQHEKPAPLFLPVLLWCVGIALSRAIAIPFIWQAIITLVIFILAIFLKSARIYLILGFRWNAMDNCSATFCFRRSI